jgi:tetratricopeptide (TPR) repeat protein
MREVFIEAMAQHRAGRLAQAEQGYRQTLTAYPRHPDALHMLGILAYQNGRNAAAADLIARAIAAQPDIASFHSNLGLALKDLGRLEDAAASFRRASALTPDAPEPHNNLGIVFTAQGRWEEALACSARALSLSADFAEAHANIGHVNRQQGKLAEAVARYRRAIGLRPDFAEAHTSLAHALLQQGEFLAGWAAYEWRWKTRSMQAGRRHFAQPQWQADPGNGRTLLVHAEQGFGDTLQFCRFITLAAARGWRIVLEVQPALQRLLRQRPHGVAAVIGRGEILPSFDAHIPLLSLPHALKIEARDIPRPPYLAADAALTAVWQSRLDAVAIKGPRIGLAWAGSHTVANAEIDRRRSIAPERLALLLRVPGINFVSLQKDGPRMPADLPIIDPMPEIADFADTAALIAGLDLVITVDTAVAHLAGGLGKPVWLLNRFDSCWRWLAGRQTSPWYPSMWIYPQPAPGDWETVIKAVLQDLARYRGNHRAG